MEVIDVGWKHTPAIVASPAKTLHCLGFNAPPSLNAVAIKTSFAAGLYFRPAPVERALWEEGAALGAVLIGRSGICPDSLTDKAAAF